MRQHFITKFDYRFLSGFFLSNLTWDSSQLFSNRNAQMMLKFFCQCNENSLS